MNAATKNAPRAPAWEVSRLGNGILLVGRGYDTSDAYKAEIAVFHMLCAEKQRCSLVADLRELTNYTTSARQAWQEAFFKERHKLANVVFLGATSRLIRMAASTASLFAGIPAVFADTWDEVERVTGTRAT